MPNKPVTLWYILKTGVEEPEFNHLEDGHSEADAPEPKFPSQKGWKGLPWWKDHAYLDENHKVVFTP